MDGIDHFRSTDDDARGERPAAVEFVGAVEDGKMPGRLMGDAGRRAVARNESIPAHEDCS